MRRAAFVTIVGTAVVAVLGLGVWYGLGELMAQTSPANKPAGDHDGPLPRSETEWQAALSPEQYRVCRGKGTEWPFRNAYWNNHRAGVYHCVACGEALFESTTKYDSGTGWPSFWAPIGREAVAENDDRSLPQYPRVEITCRKCGSHLGHLFPDGPTERTGMRYCVNSTALDFREQGK